MTRTKREREQILCEAAEVVTAILTAIPSHEVISRARCAIMLGEMGPTTAADRAIMTVWESVLTEHGSNR